MVFCSYAAVLCLERDAEASRRQAGATHFESGVLAALESDVSLKHTALWCWGCFALLSCRSSYTVLSWGWWGVALVEKARKLAGNSLPQAQAAAVAAAWVVAASEAEGRAVEWAPGG